MAYNKELLNEFIEKRSDNNYYSNFIKSLNGSYQFELIWNYINKYLPPEESMILDIGIDPAIFSEKIAQGNRSITIGDISDEQLKITREKFEKLSLSNKIDQFALIDDITQLNHFENNTFDLIISLFGTLSFTCEKRHKFLNELIRILKNGAPIIFTVKNKINYLHNLLHNNPIQFLQNPERSGIWEILESNIKQHEDFPDEPAYYCFNSNELVDFVMKNRCDVLEVTAINCLETLPNKGLVKIKENKTTWKNLLEIEEKISKDKGLLESGAEILLVARKSFF